MPRDTFVQPAIVASGTTWSQYKDAGLSAILDNLVSTNPAKANPTTTATVNVTAGGSTGGNLPAGDYYASYTYADAFGETLAGGRSAKFTVAAGNIPRVTLPSLPAGVDCINIYLTPTNGAIGSERIYGSGITTTTFDLSYALLDDPGGSLPALNTTGFFDNGGMHKAIVDPSGGSSGILKGIRSWFNSFIHGDRIGRRVALDKARSTAGYARAWATVYSEAAALIAANPPTTTTVSAGFTGYTKTKNVFA
jgi:hypothetical protein